MSWIINFENDFELEFGELSKKVQDECLAHLKLLEKFGPTLGRPQVDTFNN